MLRAAHSAARGCATQPVLRPQALWAGFSSKVHVVKAPIAGPGAQLTFETGRVAHLTDGAVWASFGDSTVLATAVCAPAADPTSDFLPLTVEYREKAYASGRIPLNKTRKETHGTDREVLGGRIVDRTIRPLFPDGFFNETQVITTVLSYGQGYDPDVLAVNAASCALAISSIPWRGPAGAVRVGWVDKKPIVNPSTEQQAASTFNLLYAATDTATLMIEAEGQPLPESHVAEAFAAGQAAVADIIKLQRTLVTRVGNSKRHVAFVVPTADMQAAARSLLYADAATFFNAGGGVSKESRTQLMGMLIGDAKAKLQTMFPEANAVMLGMACDKVFEQAMLDNILKAVTVTPSARCRADGRSITEVRPVKAEVNVLPKSHGSALFSRGDTQTLAVATLGPPEHGLEQQSVTGDGALKRFFLHYDFAPFCTNEVGKLGGVNRRMVGHGALAEKAVAPMIREKEDFPFAVRVTSDIMASDGSSSMASVCGASLALMDAGVPLVEPVAGVSIGLVTDGRHNVLLTDILGMEDHYGAMDFKVTGTKAGVTAIQLDIKTQGIPVKVLSDALWRARDARFEILGVMAKAVAASRASVKEHAPRVEYVPFPADARGQLIGVFGATVRSIEIATGATLVFDESRNGLRVWAPSNVALEAAKNAIHDTLHPKVVVKVGDVYKTRVTEVRDFGAIVEIIGEAWDPAVGYEGVLHVSEFSHSRVARMADVVDVGTELELKAVDVDALGKVKFSRRAMMERSSPTDKAPSTTPDAPTAAAASQAVQPGGNTPRRTPHGTGGSHKTHKGHDSPKAPKPQA